MRSDYCVSDPDLVSLTDEQQAENERDAREIAGHHDGAP